MRWGRLKEKLPAVWAAVASLRARIAFVAETYRLSLADSQPIRWIVAASVAFILIIVVAAGTLLANLRREQIAESTHDLESLALVLAEQIDRSFQSIGVVQDAVVDRIRRLKISSPADLEWQMSGYDTYQRLKDQIRALPHLDAIVLTDPNHKLINFSREWPTPKISPGRARFEGFNKTGPVTVVGKPIQSPANGVWVLPINRKVTDAQGQFLGIVVGAMRLDYFEQLFSAVARNHDRSIALFTRDGTLVARYPADKGLRFQSFAQRSIFRDILSNRDYGTVRQVSVNGGSELLISGRNLPHFPMSVVVTKRTADVLLGWRYAAVYVGGAAMIIALMIGGAAILVTRRIWQNLQTQNSRLDAIINNMLRGVAMFDAAGRLIVCNDRYREMYKIPPEVVARGTTLHEILCLRLDNGTYDPGTFHTPERFVERLLADVALGETMSLVQYLDDGRIISVVNKPMPDGCWVTTHDDVTEQRRREESFRFLFDNNPVPMWVFDRETFRFLAVNNAAVAHYGYSREQFMAMRTFDMRPNGDLDRFVRSLHETGGKFEGGTRRHLKADGSEIDVTVFARAFEYEGRPACLVAAHDVTDRQRAEEDLRRTKKFLDMIIENVPVPILVKDVPSQLTDAGNCRYTLVNRACEELFGVGREEIVGKTVREVYPKAQAEFIIAENNDTLNSAEPVTVSDHEVHTPQNGVRYAVARSFAVRDDDQPPRYLLTVLEDVTERRRWEQRIAHMAHYDALTELPNRITFYDALDAAIERAAKSSNEIAVLSLDLDGFKDANDTFGHAVGDALLGEVARRLQSAAEGAFVARLGGDEFAVIVGQGAQPSAAEAVAERLLLAFAGDIVVERRKISVGVTIGAAIYPKDGADSRSLMMNADLALYRAKAEARGTVLFFDLAIGERLRERRAMQLDLAAAIDKGELQLHYQPQKTIAGAMIGFEALLRWNCGKRGMVSPATFIPVAEESGLIGPIGKWVLREACREAATWAEPLTIAVNISPMQFRDRDFAATVHTILLETGLAARRLELEVTEGVLIDDLSRAVSILNRLKSLGVRIVLDDFGTGYSSLSYLHAFSFDKIKVDRAFVSGLDRSQHSMAIVRAVIDLGHSIGIPVLAEGVETAEQHTLLMRQGCDEVQGFLTGRPEPIDCYRDLVGSGMDSVMRQAI